ncbi:MAG: FeoB small GTPase domain-containing protein, partial [Moorella sp. (in: firmicutes)]
MACHDLNQQLNIPPDVRKIVLAGNPNVGKSVFFNAFTGLYVDVSNFPGTTLEISHARVGNDVVLDTPGVYGVSSFNEEEKVARDVIMEADVVINVVDAVHLERDLFLTQQIIDMGIPMVLALNMIDEAMRQGIKIDVKKMEELLGVPVIPTVAIKNVGLEEVKKAVARARIGNALPELQEMLPLVEKKTRTRAEALLILEGDPFIAARCRMKPLDRQEEIYLARRRRVDAIVAAVVQENPSGASWKTSLSRWMMHPLTGIPLLILILGILYEFIGVFVAQTVVSITEEGIMQGYYEPFIRTLIGSIIPASSIPGTLL